MAHAGGACSSIRLQVENNILYEGGSLYRLSTELVHDIEEAVYRLSCGEAVLLKTLGPNLADVRAALAAQGVIVQDPVSAAYRTQPDGEDK